MSRLVIEIEDYRQAYGTIEEIQQIVTRADEIEVADGGGRGD